MKRFLTSLLLASALLAVAQLSHAAAPSIAEFWRTVLPDYELPEGVLWHLQPEISSESTTEGTGAGDDASNAADDSAERLSRQWPYYYYTESRKVSPSHKAATDDIAEQLSRQWPYYFYTHSHKRSASQHKAVADDSIERLSRKFPSYFSTSSHKQGSVSHNSAAGSSEGHPHMQAGDNGATKTMSALFFHEEAVKVGGSLPFYFPPARRAPLGMLPRDVADSIPFSTSALPGVLARLGVAPGSDQAADMEETLSMCEAAPRAGEPKFCATSLEALVEGATAALGTRDIRPVTSTLPRSGAAWQPYTIRAVRPVVGGAGSARFVGCHDVVYPYTVYRCHDTGLARLYMVEMEGTRGGNVVTAAVICHTDTSLWDPKHLSFKLLGTKPGGPPVCHTMPHGHIVWAKKDNDRSSA